MTLPETRLTCAALFPGTPATAVNQTLSRASPSMPNPFNFTIPDTSPIFRYYPLRDGPIDSSWNVSFSGSLDSTWAPSTLGVGTSTHRTTLLGASVRLDWVGTAIYLYGEASVEAYTIELDGAATKVETNTPGLLFARSDLTYGSHSLTLHVVRGTSTTSISSAIITVGIGEPGTIIQSRTINTTTVPLTTDGMFLTGTWYEQVYYKGAGPVPRIATEFIGSAISFPISSASAFYIVGHVNYDHGPYLVTFTPPLDLGPVLTFEYNGSSRWGRLNTVTFLATGLNRSRTYHVQLTNQATSYYYDQSQIVIMDTPPAPSHDPNAPPSSGSNSQQSNSQQSLSAGSIAGIVIGVFLFLIVLIFLILLWRKRRSSQTDVMTRYYDFSATVTSPSNPLISTASPPSRPIPQKLMQEQSERNRDLPQLSAPANPESPPYPISSGLTQQNARFFNSLHALNVPAADIATMMENLRAGRDPAATMMMEGSSSNGAIRVEPEIVDLGPPRYED